MLGIWNRAFLALNSSFYTGQTLCDYGKSPNHSEHLFLITKRLAVPVRTACLGFKGQIICELTLWYWECFWV